ncbi:MAG: TetR/AcrR family transcriptional regulator [Actinomycetota bacterium]|nr:TetR/AcrR family transcriptional regulator [Actinomycetota bacterium]MDQ5807080.1 TetR/AcrR family transcriptional regulator [Actinomycetota bacterium]
MRLSREERRARTRDELLEAATRVFAAKGFHRATVDDVAADAGYTTGAVYSNFAGKEDLFLSAFEHQIARHSREVAEAVGERGTRGAAEQWMSFLSDSPEMFLLFVEYWAWAVRNPEHREKYATRFAAFRETTERLIGERSTHAGRERRRLAVMANALTYGVAFQRLVEPEAVPDDLFADALRRLFAT